MSSNEWPVAGSGVSGCEGTGGVRGPWRTLDSGQSPTSVHYR